ncbi:hypothetical protein AX16_008208 [Volvariella volvacea WC 439]|nr:hypothetical protein AX16_008208 [Volvariella volvacea WC 439]
MSARSFTVFQDTPSAESSQPKAKPAVLAVLASANTDTAVPGGGPNAPLDKENFNPMTGERAGATSKKRKALSSVLATKLHVPPESKKIKTTKEKEKESVPEAKKRKSSHPTTSTSISATANAKTKPVTTKKDSKTPAPPTRRTLRKRSMRKLALPKVEEEADAAEAEKVSKAQVDAKCYDLTVKPLADVTPAYEGGEEPKQSPAEEESTELGIREYFPTLAATSIDAAVKALASSKEASSSTAVEAKTFSTPERKRIYSAFTFNTPSPIAKANKITRASSMPPLHINFDS